MNRADFNKVVEVYSVSPVADGYGGSTVSETLVDSRWAKMVPLNAGVAVTEYGLQDPSRSIQVTIRKNDLVITQDHFIKYRGKSHQIVSGPIEIDFENKLIQFVIQEINDKSNDAAP